MWRLGTLAIGLVAADGGLFLGEGGSLLLTQAIGVVAVFAFVVVASTILLGAIKCTIGLRVTRTKNLAGSTRSSTAHPAPDFVFETIELTGPDREDERALTRN